MSMKKNVINGLELKIARIRRGMTQEELGQKIGRDQTLISKIEKGQRNPSLETLKLLCQELGQVEGGIMIPSDNGKPLKSTVN